MTHLLQRLRRGFLVALHSVVVRRCADCGCRIGQDKGPPDGWQLEDGRTVCHACCAADMGLIVRRAIFMHNRVIVAPRAGAWIETPRAKT